jgi:hypothetical protein
VRAQFGTTNNFEAELGQFLAIRNCRVTLESDAAHGEGAAAVRAIDPAAPLTVQLRDIYTRVEQYPYLMFSYKLPPGTRLDLMVETLGFHRRLSLTTPAPDIGARLAGRYPRVEAPGALLEGPLKTDGRWHRTLIDVRSFLQAAGIDVPVLLPNRFRLTGTLPGGGGMRFDDVEVVPENWARARVEWSPPAGQNDIRGYSAMLDQSPTTIPPERDNPWRERVLQEDASGRRGIWYFHIRSVDYSGNWGETRHERLNFGNP